MARSRVLALAFALGGLVMAGCGGNGSSIDSGPIANTSVSSGQNNDQPNSGDLGLFVTDSVSDKYDHVWVSFKRIDLKLAAGGTRTVFEDPQGVGVDLSSLHDDSGPKYRFLNQITIPAGTYSGATIVLDKHAVVFATNATSGESEEISGQSATPQTAGHLPGAPKAKDDKAAVITDGVSIDLTFDPPKMLGTGHDDLVFDFDLSQWKEDGGKLAGPVTTSLGAGLEAADRNSPVFEEGEINSLKGDVPTETFTLKKEKSADIEVQTNNATALVGGSPVLAKGQPAEVLGTFDTNTRRLLATSISVLDPKAPALAEIEGTVTSADPKAATWAVNPSETHGLLPTGLTVTATPALDAKFVSGSGLAISKDDYFKGLSASKDVTVFVRGSYDSAKNVFTVADAHLADASMQPEVKVSGLISNPKTDSQTFGLTVTDFEGLMSKPGAGQVVSVTPATTFAAASGKRMTTDQFFAGLATPMVAEVDGDLDTSTGNVVANTVKLTPAPAAVVSAVAKVKKSAKPSK